MTRLFIVLAIVVAFPLAAFAGPDEDAVRAADAKWEKAYKSGDAAAVAALYTEDAAVFPPGGSRTDGREAIAGMWNGAMESGLADVKIMPVEIEIIGDTAIDVGFLSGTVPGEGDARTPVSGKYIVVWKRNGGEWLLHRDIWNMDQ